MSAPQVIAQPLSPPPITQKTWSLTDKERIQSLITQGQSQQALAELHLFGAAPYGQAEFDYLLGVAALEVGQYALALESLERVVLINPQHAGAWLDLAMVHYRLNDYEAARLMMQHVQDHFSPTPTLTSQLRSLQHQLTWAPYTKDWLIDVSTHVGYVKNVNAGLNQLNFALTPLGGLPIDVQLDQKQAPRSDQALLLRANAYRMVKHEAGAYSEWLISLGSREYMTEKSYGLADVGVMWLYSHPWRGMEWQVGPSMREIVLGGRPIGELYGGQVSLWQSFAGCRVAPRLEIESRRYREPGYYDNWVPWLGVLTRCDHESYLYGGSIRAGLDQAASNRPGGNTQKTELMVFGKYYLRSDWAMDLMLGYSDYRDREAYSPLIANGVKRTIDRWVGRVGLEWQASSIGYKNIYVSAYFDYYKDKSNIIFSNIQDRQIFMGARYLWH